MEPRLLVGTVNGLAAFDPGSASRRDALGGHEITGIAVGARRTWAIVDGKTLRTGDDWSAVARVDGPPATCLVATASDVVAGTEAAHLLRLGGDRLEPVTSFEAVPGRDTWYTPWGDPADVRSIAVGADGALYVNVHVGGVARSRDGGGSWTPTVDVEADVHQVVAHPTRAGVVLVASAAGFGLSRDGADSWVFTNDGLHAHYLRAVAVADDLVFVSAATGFRGKRAAIYRKPLDGGAFACCQTGLPKWFDGNIDTACLAVAGRLVAFGTEDGCLYVSHDAGDTWALHAKDLGAVRAVVFA